MTPKPFRVTPQPHSTRARLSVAVYFVVGWLWTKKRYALLAGLLVLNAAILLFCPHLPVCAPLVPLPVPVAAPAPPVAPQQSETPPVKYTLIQTLRVREGHNVWRLEKWHPQEFSDRVDELKFYCNGCLVSKISAGDVEGDTFGLGKIMFPSRFPVVVVGGSNAAGMNELKRFYTFRHGRIILMHETNLYTGGPLLRGCGGDGRPKWVFDDYDWYIYRNQGPARRMIYKQQADGSLKLWQIRSNSYRRHLPDTVHWLHQKE